MLLYTHIYICHSNIAFWRHRIFKFSIFCTWKYRKANSCYTVIFAPIFTKEHLTKSYFTSTYREENVLAIAHLKIKTSLQWLSKSLFSDYWLLMSASHCFLQVRVNVGYLSKWMPAVLERQTINYSHPQTLSCHSKMHSIFCFHCLYLS
jgi:hypothetical protein